MTLGYSIFLKDAVGFFANNPDMTFFRNSDAYFVAIREPEIDSIVVYEWHEMIEFYSAHIDLHKKEKDEKGKNK